MNKRECDRECTKCEKPCFADKYPKEKEIEDISKLYKVLGEKNRLHIVYALCDKQMCVHELEELLQISQSLVSHQLKILRDAKIVKSIKPFVERYTTPSGEKCACYMFVATDEGHSDNSSWDSHDTYFIDFDKVEDKLSYENLKKSWQEIKGEIQKLF